MADKKMRRILRQMSFACGLVKQRSGRNEWLNDIDKLIDWSSVDAVLSPIYAADEGRPSFPIITLVKLLLIQQWYSLSDAALEEAVDDRLSFRRFVGLPLDETAPDHTTIWRFRQELSNRDLSEALFAEINRQLDAHGMIVRRGTLIDATIVKAAVKPPPGKDGEVSERDPQAGWTKKSGKSIYGYKAHVAVDEESNLIRDAKMTGADVHDSLVGPELVQGDEQTVYADKAYGNKAFRDKLASEGIKDGLMHKAARNKPLKNWQKWFNKAVSPIRAGVERSFATMKRHYGFTQVRYINLSRNRCSLHLMCAAINLRRALVLAA